MLKLAITLCVLNSSLAAQWPKYPTPGVPRTADGKPDLSAPAPRTASGRPDLSGMWLPKDEVPCPKMILDDAGTCAERVAPSRQAVNIAFGIPGGLPLQPWAAELIK